MSESDVFTRPTLAVTSFPNLKVSCQSEEVLKLTRAVGQSLRQLFANSLCLVNEREKEAMTQSILDNVLLTGGICRDLLLGADVKDVDIVLKTRELCGIQRRHLLERHSTSGQQRDERNSQCFLWRLYLNCARRKEENVQLLDAIKQQFVARQWPVSEMANGSADIRTFDDWMKTGYRYVTGCNYLLNARFFASVFSALQPFASALEQLEVVKYDWFNSYSVKVVCNESAVCSQTEIDYSLTFFEMADSWTDAVNWQQSVRQFTTLDTRQLFEETVVLFDSSPENGQSFSKEIIPIDIPDYRGDVRSRFLVTDVTVNMLVLPLSTVASLPSVRHLDACHMQSAIESVDVFADLRSKVLRTAPCLKQCIASHSPMVHWWRLLKAKMRMPDFAIDSQLLAAHIDCYTQWLSSDQFFGDKHSLDAFLYFFTGFLTTVRTPELLQKWLQALAAMRSLESLALAVSKHSRLQRALRCHFCANLRYVNAFAKAKCLISLSRNKLLRFKSAL